MITDNDRRGRDGAGRAPEGFEGVIPVYCRGGLRRDRRGEKLPDVGASIAARSYLRREAYVTFEAFGPRFPHIRSRPGASLRSLRVTLKSGRKPSIPSPRCKALRRSPMGLGAGLADVAAGFAAARVAHALAQHASSKTRSTV